MTAIGSLLSAGQSPWLDYIRRSLLTSGELQRMVEHDGITGVTINPTIFEKAIVGSHDYDDGIRVLLAGDPQLTPAALYERLAVQDVAAAADVLRPVYDRTHGEDGFVSLEVAPGLAHDTEGTVGEARRLWKEVDRPNVMIKVPGTPEGVPAIEQLLAEGINVNVTLLFSKSQYEAVAQAFLRGIARVAAPAGIASVASVFVSRIDAVVDRMLDASSSPDAKTIRGKVALANCRLVYERYQQLFDGPEFAAWRAKGARPQRVLWASTSTKDPTYRDTMYVEELIGPETVDTIPPATIAAFEAHGVVRGSTVLEGLPEARTTLATAAAVGVDLERVTADLQTEGLALFTASYASLLNSIDGKRTAILSASLDPQRSTLPIGGTAVSARLEGWETSRTGARIWRLDPTLWPDANPSDVASRLGWLHLPELMHEQVAPLSAFAEGVRADGIRHVVLLGMGGSSLAPDVLRRVFGNRVGFPALIVLDSTHPEAVASVQSQIDPKATLFVVSSKSGTTTEPLSFYRYFWEVVRASGVDPASHFVAVTDPGTPLETLARDQKFRAVFPALPTVGGRYSALTTFGLVPAALLGVDLPGLLGQAWTMAASCAPSVPAPQSPGLGLGAILGELAADGRDKLTFYAAGGLAAFPDWAEQLVAESTGKIDKGIVPVVDEPFATVSEYGDDRLFVVMQNAARPDPALEAHAAQLEGAGHPVVRIGWAEPLDLGQEFFRWEFAVASAGIVLGINPFDQPDVEFAKELARQAMAHPTAPGGTEGPATVRADDGASLDRAVPAWMDLCRPGDYVAVQAYLPPSPETTALLQDVRLRLLRQLKVATTLGYGPRFLHSTGQLHKGGPNTGLFLQIVDSPASDFAVPGSGFTFGELIRAQALGDYQALEQRERRILRVDLGTDRAGGLRRIAEAIDG